MKKKFELIFAKEALKNLKKLDRQSQIRVLKEAKTLVVNPTAGKQLVGRLSELRSLRVGNYRVIYQIDNQKVVIRAIGHRKKVYDK
jgi:mRNA interferase RelE/StbE